MHGNLQTDSLSIYQSFNLLEHALTLCLEVVVLATEGVVSRTTSTSTLVTVLPASLTSETECSEMAGSAIEV